MNRLIDDNGNLKIDDLLLNNESLNAILEDGVITQEEKYAQSAKVVGILKQIDQICSDEEVELVRQLLAEMTALIIVSQGHSEK